MGFKNDEKVLIIIITIQFPLVGVITVLILCFTACVHLFKKKKFHSKEVF